MVDTARLVKTYIKMRDAKEEIAARHKEELAELSTNMHKIEVALLEAAIEQHVDGFKTEFGTASLVESMKVSCSDWAVFTDFLKDKDPLDFMEKKLRTSAIKEYMDASEGQLPPGVSVFKENTIRVTRPRAK